MKIIYTPLNSKKLTAVSIALKVVKFCNKWHTHNASSPVCYRCTSDYKSLIIKYNLLL